MPADRSSERHKRFYATADIAPADGGYAVTLDGRTPRSPEGAALVLPTAGLAQLVAEEWAGQGEEIEPATMPATRLAWTAIVYAADPAARAAAAARMGAFANADVLCYFAEAPAPLVRRQEQQWSPMIAWAEDALQVRFIRARGVVHQPQPEATIARIEALATAEDAATLSALAAAAALYGSVILAFALRHGELTGEEALNRSRVDEIFQEEQWGVDAEAAARVTGVAREATMLERWFASSQAWASLR